MASVTNSRAGSVAGQEQGHREEGTYNAILNRKLTLPKLMDDSSDNALWIRLANAQQYLENGCSIHTLECEIDKSLSSGYWGALEDREMGCTEAAEHTTKVTKLRPFKERPQNIQICRSMEESSKQYTAFTFRTLRFFQCEHMPFWLCNTPVTFQRLMTVWET